LGDTHRAARGGDRCSIEEEGDVEREQIETVQRDLGLFSVFRPGDRSVERHAHTYRIKPIKRWPRSYLAQPQVQDPTADDLAFRSQADQYAHELQNYLLSVFHCSSREMARDRPNSDAGPPRNTSGNLSPGS
jgi:hypothetical protein